MAGGLKGVSGFAALGGAVLFALGVACGMPESCEAGAKGQDKIAISMDVRNETLKNVLEEISKAAGYEITVTGGWGNKRLSIKLVDASLERSLKEAIARVGKPNHAILTDPSRKKIKIMILVESPVAGKKEFAPEQRKPVDPMEMEVIPPEREGELGLTRGEVDAIQNQHPPLDMNRVEVIPPEGNDERGLTRAEVNEQAERQKKAEQTEQGASLR